MAAQTKNTKILKKSRVNTRVWVVIALFVIAGIVCTICLYRTIEKNRQRRRVMVVNNDIMAIKTAIDDMVLTQHRLPENVLELPLSDDVESRIIRDYSWASHADGTAYRLCVPADVMVDAGLLTDMPYVVDNMQCFTAQVQFPAGSPSEPSNRANIQ